MAHNHENSGQISEALRIEENLYERYKKQKLQLSSKLMKTIFRITTIVPLILILFSSFIALFSPAEILVGIGFSVLSFILQILNERSSKTYALRMFFYCDSGMQSNVSGIIEISSVFRTLCCNVSFLYVAWAS